MFKNTYLTYCIRITEVVGILHLPPAHTPRMYPVVAHAPCVYCSCIPYCSYVTARSGTGGPGGPQHASGPLLIVYGIELKPLHSLYIYRYVPSPTHPPPVFIPVCVGVCAPWHAHTCIV
jgi:hypothetical protein